MDIVNQLQDSLYIFDDPDNNIDIGSYLSLTNTYNETKMRNKLRLSKAYLKSTLNLNLGVKVPLYQQKFSNIEELIRCDQLKTSRPEFEHLIDCKPIEAHILDDTFRSTGVDKTSEFDKFVRRSSFRAKTSPKIFGKPSRQDILLYPLQKETVDKDIAKRGEECNVTDKSFFANNLNLGFYFDLKWNTGNINFLNCTGRTYLSINRTKVMVRKPDEAYPEFLDELQYFKDQAKENGYLFNLQDVECGSNLKLLMNFTIVQRKQFPYLALRHKVETIPHLAYRLTSSVDQVLHSEFGNPLHYNTTVDIKSFSVLAEFLRFNLEQVFINKGPSVGGEFMTMAWDQSGIGVRGEYNETDFFKKAFLALNPTSFFDLKAEGDEGMKPVFSITYLEDPSDDGTILIRINKKNWKSKLVEYFTGNYLYDKFSLENSSPPIKTTVHVDEL